MFFMSLSARGGRTLSSALLVIETAWYISQKRIDFLVPLLGGGLGTSVENDSVKSGFLGRKGN